MDPIELNKHQLELVGHLNAATRKNFIMVKPKIMDCVRLSDILLDGTYYCVDLIDDIGEKTTIKSKTNSEMARTSQSNSISNKKDKISDIEQLDEFTMLNLIYNKTFPTVKTAIQYIQDTKTLNLITTGRVIGTNNTMNYYRCNLASEAGIVCPVKNYLLIESNSPAILYRNAESHNHESIEKIFEIDSCIELSDEEENSIPSSDTVELWLASIVQIPKEDHTVYCVDYFIDRHMKKSRFFLTTRQLLNLVIESRAIHITSLETIQWKKNQVILVGTTDLDRKFHNFGLMVCNSKTASDYEFIFSSIQKGVKQCFPNKLFRIDTLISDCNPAIQNAFKYVYGSAAKTVTSLADFSSKISKLFEKTNYTGIIDDIIKLQMLPSTDLFNFGVKLFLKKWDSKSIEQFKSQWLDKNCNWYEGYSYCTPSNSAVLQEYERFRKTYLYKPLDSLELFLDQLFVAVRNWSHLYIEGYKYAIKSTETPKVLELACQWLHAPKNLKIEKFDTETFYYVNLDLKYFDSNSFKIYRGRQFTTFDDFIAIRSKYCTVRKNQQNVIICDCAVFYKLLVCQHSIGIGFLLDLYKIPLSIIPNPSQIPCYLTLY